MTIAVTMGDPAGIGPEIAAKLFARENLSVPTFVIGDCRAIRQQVDSLSLDLSVRPIDCPADVPVDPKVLPVLNIGTLPGTIPLGKVDRDCGAAAFAYVKKGIELAMAGHIDALVTAPIHKEALALAGIEYPGHTEILASLTKTENFAMMLMNDDLRVILVTVHVAMRDVPELITVEREQATIELAREACKHMGIDKPRIAVAGLNPHAGENGLFGNEDTDFILPAIERCRESGIDVSGPWPGDTVFMRARGGEFDIVVAQYHDQGLIPVKYLGLDEGVNVTVGLPFVRTSVDHGTAFDIAGKGVADHRSLHVAYKQALAMIRGRAEAAQ